MVYLDRSGIHPPLHISTIVSKHTSPLPRLTLFVSTQNQWNILYPCPWDHSSGTTRLESPWSRRKSCRVLEIYLTTVNGIRAASLLLWFR